LRARVLLVPDACVTACIGRAYGVRRMFVPEFARGRGGGDGFTVARAPAAGEVARAREPEREHDEREPPRESAEL
jgi:hypothetical protein